ncbi:SIMPL domain-containing protein [Halioxenophilus sp. WMMB6]|uniref:SIMPL domain-containing protein n=1 Tax=Halioxenophilus sp. WMMB6 TaxID=3073815 RepID=UPI00295E6F8B|nr:SIMPL domain-containing protein [Halioxenophilus sp. WMMB6]
MFKRCVVGVLAIGSCCVSGWSFAAAELTGSAEELRSFLHPNEKLVSLAGDAEQKAYSDEALVSMVVSTKAKQLAEALEANARLRDSMRAQLLAGGIAADDINNSQFSSSPQYGWFGKTPSSFEVANRVVVRITHEQQLQLLAEVADQHSEIDLADTEFKHSKKEHFLQLVKQTALDKVLVEKALYEKNLGVKLTPVNFREERLLTHATPGARMLEEIVVTARRRDSSYADVPVARKEPATRFDEIEYSAHIVVDFKIVAQSDQAQ